MKRLKFMKFYCLKKSLTHTHANTIGQIVKPPPHPAGPPKRLWMGAGATLLNHCSGVAQSLQPSKRGSRHTSACEAIARRRGELLPEAFSTRKSRLLKIGGKKIADCQAKSPVSHSRTLRPTALARILRVLGGGGRGVTLALALAWSRLQQGLSGGWARHPMQQPRDAADLHLKPAQHQTRLIEAQGRHFRPGGGGLWHNLRDANLAIAICLGCIQNRASLDESRGSKSWAG